MATYRLLGSTTPGNSYSAPTEYYVKAHEFYVTQKAWVTTLWYYRPTTATTATATSAIYSVDAGGTTGTQVSGTSGSFAAGSTTGWVSRTLASPVVLIPLQHYRVAIYYSNTLFGYTSDFWTTGAGSAGIANGPLVAPSDATAIGTMQASYKYTPTNAGLAFPDTDNFGELAGADVTVTDVDPFGTSQNQFFSVVQP